MLAKIIEKLQISENKLTHNSSAKSKKKGGNDQVSKKTAAVSESCISKNESKLVDKKERTFDTSVNNENRPDPLNALSRTLIKMDLEIDHLKKKELRNELKKQLLNAQNLERGVKKPDGMLKPVVNLSANQCLLDNQELNTIIISKKEIEFEKSIFDRLCIPEKYNELCLYLSKPSAGTLIGTFNHENSKKVLQKAVELVETLTYLSAQETALSHNAEMKKTRERLSLICAIENHLRVVKGFESSALEMLSRINNDQPSCDQYINNPITMPNNKEDFSSFVLDPVRFVMLIAQCNNMESPKDLFKARNAFFLLSSSHNNRAVLEYQINTHLNNAKILEECYKKNVENLDKQLKILSRNDLNQESDLELEQNVLMEANVSIPTMSYVSIPTTPWKLYTYVKNPPHFLALIHQCKNILTLRELNDARLHLFMLNRELLKKISGKPVEQQKIDTLKNQIEKSLNNGQNYELTILKEKKDSDKHDTPIISIPATIQEFQLYAGSAPHYFALIRQCNHPDSCFFLCMTVLLIDLLRTNEVSPQVKIKIEKDITENFYTLQNLEKAFLMRSKNFKEEC